MIRRHLLLRPAALALVALLLAAGASCGDDDDVETSTGADDVPADPDPGDQAFASDEAREEARSLLGQPESALGEEVRVSRRGEEDFFLTEDYVLGRLTVELDDDGSGTFVVTSVRVELPDGPETFDT
jgi:hypothetical protein